MGFAVGNGQYRKKSIALGAGQTVDTVVEPVLEFVARRFIVRHSGNSLNQLVNIDAVKRGSTVEINIFSKLGDTLAVTPNVIIVGADVVLRFTNGEGFAIDTVVQTIKL